MVPGGDLVKSEGKTPLVPEGCGYRRGNTPSLHPVFLEPGTLVYIHEGQDGDTGSSFVELERHGYVIQPLLLYK